MPGRRWRPLLLLAFLLLSAVGGEPPATVTPAELSAWLEARPADVVVLDIRGSPAYRRGTIEGAMDVGSDPAKAVTDGRRGIVVLLAEEPSDLALVVRWTDKLRRAGHTVRVLAGGLPAWQAAGLPVVEPTRGLVRPGTVPFVIPRGLCESRDPVQEYK
jgi:rhodanese-related sulfurtransferase